MWTHTFFTYISFSWFLLYAEWDNKEEGKEATQQWEDDWDDDDVNDDFSVQLKKELDNNTAEKKWARVYYPLLLLVHSANITL